LIAPLKSNTEDLTVPDIEWWDAALLPPTGYASLDDEGGLVSALESGKSRDKVTHLIQHPVELKPPGESDQPVALPVMLTKKERKKMRTQRRKAEERDRQEKIRLGLMEAPAPKVKKANFMRVLGNDAVSNPTLVEKVGNL
jgi:U4/U6 small nuclear ribonucleoprotein PRP3